MITMLNRMCWNSRGWHLPAGNPGKAGYPGKMGFGHEEWNFQTQDEADGFIYGYLYYTPSTEAIKRSGGHFKIFFWSIHPDSREKLIVGTYSDATLAVDDDYKKVDSVFTKRGIYERRAKELSAAVPKMPYDEALRQVTLSVNEHWLKFKCPVDSVHPLAEYVPVYEITKKGLGMYFARPTFIYDAELPDIPRRPEPSSQGKPFSQNIAALAEDAYYRESPQNLTRILRRHNELSNAFARWLRETGYSIVLQEQNYVDVVFERKNKTYRAELKICYGAGSTKAIREALGQLFEYNYYPGRSKADQWAIVLDQKATRDDKEYLQSLKTKLNLPLSLGWQEGKEFVFADRLEL